MEDLVISEYKSLKVLSAAIFVPNCSFKSPENGTFYSYYVSSLPN